MLRLASALLLGLILAFPAACGRAATPAPPSTPESSGDAGHQLGKLSLGLSDRDAVAELGDPESKTPAEERGVDGMLQSVWIWPARGVELVMVATTADGADGPFTVDSIRALAPCELTTDKGIAIGATREQVTAAYGKDINTEESRPDSIVVGSIYGGVIFAVEGDKVTTIFIGAGAE